MQPSTLILCNRPAGIGSSPAASRGLLGLVLVVLFVAAVACGPRRSPQAVPEVPGRGLTPVIIIPGVTGTRLEHADTGKVVWGNARAVFLPRDAGYAGALPIADAETRVGAGDVVWRVKVAGLIPVRAYGAVARDLERQGFRLGDLRDPHPDETLFFLAYDWREDSVKTAALLAEQLENLRRVRGEETLHVNLICQSGGAVVGRWFVKFGGATLAEARAGARAPETVAVDRMILVATANGGAMRLMREMDRGRRYVAGGRLFSPELFFTFRSLFDGLPALSTDTFVDARGQPLDVDLFDPENWVRYGWSIWGRKASRRVARDGDPAVFGDEEQRRAYLAQRLADSRELQELLLRDLDPAPPTRYMTIQNAYMSTPARAALVQEEDGSWSTLFAGDRRVSKNPALRDRLTAPGDGHATVDSQFALAPQELAALAHDPIYVDDSHFHMILDPATRRHVSAFLCERGQVFTFDIGGGYVPGAGSAECQK